MVLFGFQQCSHPDAQHSNCGNNAGRGGWQGERNMSVLFDLEGESSIVENKWISRGKNFDNYNGRPQPRATILIACTF